MRQSLISFLLILACILSIFPPNGVSVVANSPSNIFISEINFRGAISSSRCILEDKLSNYNPTTNWCGKDQWVEIHNPTSSAVNLDGLNLEFRNKKPASLNGQTIPANGNLIVNFTQSNFKSIINDSDLSSYNILFISTESDPNISKHNVTAILKSGNDVIDSINTHPNTIDSDYLNARGKSYFRCSSTEVWQISTTKYGPEENYSTPKTQDPKCLTNTVQKDITIVSPPIVNKIDLENPTSQGQNNTLETTQPEKLVNPVPKQTSAVTAASKSAAIVQEQTVEQAIVEEVIVPKFELTNLPNINLASLKSDNISYSLENVQIKKDTSVNFGEFNLPNNNLGQSYKHEFKSLISYYYQENLSLLNILLLTGLVFKSINNINTKIVNYYASRNQKRWKFNF